MKEHLFLPLGGGNAAVVSGSDWSSAVTDKPKLTCVGTSGGYTPAREFADAETQTMRTVVPFPNEMRCVNNTYCWPGMTLFWRTKAGWTGAAGNYVRWNWSVECNEDGDVIPAPIDTSYAKVSTYRADAAAAMVTTSDLGIMRMGAGASCNPGDLMWITLTREGAGSEDDITQTVEVLGVDLSWTRYQQ